MMRLVRNKVSLQLSRNMCLKGSPCFDSQAEDAEDSLTKRVSMSDQVNVLGEGGKPSVPNVDESAPAGGQEGSAAVTEEGE